MNFVTCIWTNIKWIGLFNQQPQLMNFYRSTKNHSKKYYGHFRRQFYCMAIAIKKRSLACSLHCKYFIAFRKQKLKKSPLAVVAWQALLDMKKSIMRSLKK